EAEAGRVEPRVLVTALGDARAEIDFVARAVAQPHRRELRAQRANRGEAGLDRRRGGRVVAGIERALRLPRLLDDGREAAGERGRRGRPRGVRGARGAEADTTDRPALG